MDKQLLTLSNPIHQTISEQLKHGAHDVLDFTWSNQTICSIRSFAAPTLSAPLGDFLGLPFLGCPRLAVRCNGRDS